jgi:hypothetical protein
MLKKILKKARKVIRVAAVSVSRATRPQVVKARRRFGDIPAIATEMTGRGKKRAQIDEFLMKLAEFERSHATSHKAKYARRMRFALERERERVISEWAFAGNGVLEQIKVDVEARVTATEAEIHKMIARLVEMGAKNVDHTFLLSDTEDHGLRFTCSARDLIGISSEMHDKMTASFYPDRNCG